MLGVLVKPVHVGLLEVPPSRILHQFHPHCSQDPSHEAALAREQSLSVHNMTVFLKGQLARVPRASRPQIYVGRKGACKAVSETLNGCPGAPRATSWLRLTCLLWIFVTPFLCADLHPGYHS